MNKKANENGKENNSKAKKAKGLHMSAATPEGKNRGAKPMKVTEDPRFAQAVQSYEAGLKALQTTSTTRPRLTSRRCWPAPARSWRTARMST